MNNKVYTKQDIDTISRRESLVLSAFNLTDADEVTAYSVYSDVFQYGSHYLQARPLNCEYRMVDGKRVNVEEPSDDIKDMHANQIILREDGYFINSKGEKQDKMSPWVIFEDGLSFEKALDKIKRYNLFAITNGLSYFGRKRTLSHASMCFALIVDLDGCLDARSDDKVLAFCREMAETGFIPTPNYLVFSGTGMHLYYVFETPIRLYPNIKVQLENFRKDLVFRVWHGYTSELSVQVENLDQGFRLIGGKTKIPNKSVRAFGLRKHKWELLELREYLVEHFGNNVTEIDLEDKYIHNPYNLAEAKRLFPEWYERRIVRKEGKKHFKVNCYDWWLRQIQDRENGASFGHRYNCIMILAIYALKSDIPYERLENDALSLMPFLNTLAREPFLEKEMYKALKVYFDEKYYTFPLKSIKYLSGIMILPQKRNGRNQKDHLRRARTLRDIDHENWREGNGRKPKENVVKEWRANHPNGKKADCIRDTGLSKPTVYKWWEV